MTAALTIATLTAEARLAALQGEITLVERMLREHDRAHLAYHVEEFVSYAGTRFRAIDPTLRTRVCDLCGGLFWERPHRGRHREYCDWCRQTRRTATGAEYQRRVRRARAQEGER